MSRVLAETSWKILVPAIVAIVTLLAFSLLSSPIAAATPVTAPPLGPGAGGTAGIPTYPVKLTASPKSASYGIGQSPSVTISERNTGAATFNATKCVGMIEVPGSHTYVKFACPGFVAFSVGHGSTAKQTYSVYPYTITNTTATGTYHVKVHFVGTVGGVAYKTKTVTFTVTVT
jgi:hypothetical protein